MSKSMFFGKACEYEVVSKLLNQGLDIYVPVVDFKGIDYVIKLTDDKHVDIQVKGRKPRWIFTFAKFKPRPNYFFILIPPDQKTYVVPSHIISKWLSGKSKVNLSKKKKDELSRYDNRFDLLSK